MIFWLFTVIFRQFASRVRFLRSLKESSGLYRTSLVNRVSRIESRNCLTMFMDVTIDMKTWVLSEDESPLHTRYRRDNLLQRILAHMDGQFRTSSGTVLDEKLGSCNTRRPSSAWKDSSASSKEWRGTLFLEPYSRTRCIQLSTILHDDKGFRRPWNAPSWPFGKKAAWAFCFRSLMHAWLEGEVSHHTPRHFSDFKRKIFRQTGSQKRFAWWEEENLSRQRWSSLDLVKDLTKEAWSVASYMLDAIVWRSSAWAKAPRKIPLVLIPRDLDLNSESKGSMTRLKSIGESTDPWRIPLPMAKRVDMPVPNLTWLVRLWYQSQRSLQHLPLTPA